MKFFQWLITMFYWLQAFIAPVLVFGLIALLVYGKIKNIAVGVVLLATAVFGGVLFGSLFGVAMDSKHSLPPYTEAVN